MATSNAELRISPGAWHGFQVLVGWLEERIRAIRSQDGPLAIPKVAVVVPSRTLVARLGRLLSAHPSFRVGVEVTTLHQLASRIAEGLRPGQQRASIDRSTIAADDASLDGAAGFGAEEEQRADAALELACLRLLGQDEELAGALADFERAHGLLAATLRDLFDAGLSQAHLQACVEAVAQSRTRTRLAPTKLLSAASMVLHILDDARLRPHWQLYSDAAERLAGADPGLPELDAVVVYGFSDATGLAGELLERLLSHYGGLAVMELPPDPFEPSRPLRLPTPGQAPPAWRYTSRFMAFLSGVCAGGTASAEPAPEPFAHVELIEAPDPESELRAVAARIRRLIDQGVAPEDVAIVVRSLEPYASLLRRILLDHELPFSAPVTRNVGPVRPAARRVRALGQLLRDQGGLALGPFLTLRESNQEQRVVALALRKLGVVSTEALAALAETSTLQDVIVTSFWAMGEEGDETEGGYEPTRGNETEGPSGSGTGPQEGQVQPREPHGRSWRRALVVSAARIRALAETARAVLQRLHEWPGTARWDEHLRALVGLCETTLGWPEEESAELWEDLARLLPAEAVLTAREFFHLAEPYLSDWGRLPLGGQGAGVQVLDVVHARSAPFEHLFLVGANADIFPRRVTEDPLLRDEARLRLRSVLEAVPVKGEGHDEELFLFCQLLQEGRRVTISWSEADETGKPRVRSPFLDRLLAAQANLSPQRVAHWHRRALDPESLPTIWETAVAWALAREPNPERPLAAVLRWAARRLAADPIPLQTDLDAVALGRRRVQEELTRTRSGLGPYLEPVEPTPPPPGFVGAWEGYARCPWRSLVTRVLGIEPLPDPDVELARLDSRLEGIVVHRALELAVRRALRPPAWRTRAHLADLRARKPVSVQLPDDPYDLALEAAEQVLAEEAAPSDLAPALALAAVGYLESARRDLQGAAVLAAEVTGEVPFEGLEGGLRFRADRVDLTGSGLLLTDYKTGRAATAGSVAKEVRRGTLLQAVVYAQASGPGVGRYLWLSGDGLGAGQVRVLPRRDAETETAGGGKRKKTGQPKDALVLEGLWPEAADTLHLLVEGWRRGWFPPTRMLTEDRACRNCPVRLACLRSNPHLRRRIRTWWQEADEESLPRRLLERMEAKL